MKELRIQAVHTWVKLKNIMSQRSLTQKRTHYMMLFVMFKNRQN